MLHRIFIAINLSEEIKKELKTVLVSLKKSFRRAPLKWVKDNQLHMTLHFLGNLTDEQVEEMAKMLEVVISKYSKIQLRLGAIGFFPNIQRPRVAFVEALDSGEIEKMQVEIGKELQKLGFRIDSRPWHPHITLARINGVVHTKIFEKQEIKPIEFEVGSVELMESELKPDGAAHTVLKSFKFS